MEKDTNPTHAHIWEPIFGKHHESMVRSGSYRSSIGEDIFDNEYEWEGLSGESEECRKCGLNLDTVYHTTTLVRYANNLWYYLDACKRGYKITTAGTHGLNQAAQEHIKNVMERITWILSPMMRFWDINAKPAMLPRRVKIKMLSIIRLWLI